MKQQNRKSIGKSLLAIKTSVIQTLVLFFAAALSLGACGTKEAVTIYTAAEDYRIEHMQAALNEQFPEYDIRIEYKSTESLVATLIAEGGSTSCDIFFDVEYLNAGKLDAQGLLADVSAYDTGVFLEETTTSRTYLPENRTGGAIVVNKTVLDSRNLAVPASYEDLLKEEYRGLVVMPSPKSSATGYMFYHNLINILGEEEGLAYFEKLSANIIEYTASGSKVVSMLVDGEAAIAFGMTSDAVTKINSGSSDLEILFFAEGSPFSLFAQGIIEGKQDREAVKEVFAFLVNTETKAQNELYYPEIIYKDTDNTANIANYPQNIVYGDMRDYTYERKDRLLDRWTFSN